MKVIIANDTGIFREKISMSVSGVDLISSIKHALNYDDAINLFEKDHPEVVVLDISKSIENALKFFEYVKGVNPNTIVFMLVNSLQEKYEKKCSDLHTDYYFDKILEYDEMLDTIISLVNRKNTFN